MRRCRINLPNRRYRLIGRVAHRGYFLDGDDRTRLADFGRRVAEYAAGVTTFIYDDVYDSAVRRINASKSGVAFDHDEMVTYGYNSRSELTNAVASVDSDYHDEANAVVDLSFSTCE